MKSISCTRRLQFCAGHRVYGHESKCSHLHGHNYVVYIEAQADLDAIGRVVDFSVLKEFYGGWIDRNWDHGFLLWDKDTEAIAAVSACKGVGGCAQKLYLMPSNPTAENIAEYLRREVGAAFTAQHGIKIVSVRVWETENCYADSR